MVARHSSFSARGRKWGLDPITVTRGPFGFPPRLAARGAIPAQMLTLRRPLPILPAIEGANARGEAAQVLPQAQVPQPGRRPRRRPCRGRRAPAEGLRLPLLQEVAPDHGLTREGGAPPKGPAAVSTAKFLSASRVTDAGIGWRQVDARGGTDYSLGPRQDATGSIPSPPKKK